MAEFETLSLVSDLTTLQTVPQQQPFVAFFIAFWQMKLACGSLIYFITPFLPLTDDFSARIWVRHIGMFLNVFIFWFIRSSWFILADPSLKLFTQNSFKPKRECELNLIYLGIQNHFTLYWQLLYLKIGGYMVPHIPLPKSSKKVSLCYFLQNWEE